MVVDERPEPQRIEIELTSHEPSTDRRGHRAPSESPQSPESPEMSESPDGAVEAEVIGGGGPLGSERGRLLLVGASAACVALLLGVVVGRMGAGDVASVDDDDVATSTAAPAPTTTRARNTDTLPPAPDLAPVPTTIPRVSVGEPVDSDELVPGAISVNPEMRAAAVEVVVLTVRGEVVRVDTATGGTVTTSVDGSQFGPPSIYAGDGWILIPSFDEARGSTVLHDDGTRSTFDARFSWPLLRGTADGTFWRFDEEATFGGSQRLVQTSISAGDFGVAIEIDGFYPQVADPLGGVVVQAPGGFYVVAPESSTRLTTGSLLALGLNRALVYECGDSLDCGYFVIDRTTGQRTSLMLDPALGEQPTIEPAGWWAFPEPVSPDGSAALINFWNPLSGGRQSSGVLDLTTGTYVEIAAAIDTPSMEWSPDSRNVYWIDRGRLMVFDRATGDSVLFSEELGTINAFTLRAAVPSVDGPPATSDPAGTASDG